MQHGKRSNMQEQASSVRPGDWLTCRVEMPPSQLASCAAITRDASAVYWNLLTNPMAVAMRDAMCTHHYSDCYCCCKVCTHAFYGCYNLACTPDSTQEHSGEGWAATCRNHPVQNNKPLRHNLQLPATRARIANPPGHRQQGPWTGDSHVFRASILQYLKSRSGPDCPIHTACTALACHHQCQQSPPTNHNSC